MATDTSVSPYFDDYQESKNFHKILFKPGVAVQTRELNQTQTILQNQIKRMGDYLFTDGQKVTGTKPSVNLDARTVRLTAKNYLGETIVLSNFLGKYVSSLNSDIVGLVEFVFEKDDPSIGDLPSIVISLKKFTPNDNGIFPEKDTLSFYDTITEALNKTTSPLTAVVEQNVVKNATSSLTAFSKIVTLASPSSLIEVGDLLVHPSITKDIRVVSVNSSTEIEIDTAPGITIGSENIQYTKQSTCPTSIVTQDVSYFYKNGYLVRSNLQKIVPDKNTDKPSKVIGLIVSESIINSSDDSSLLDPAIGSSNYFAPGADRLKIDLSIANFDLTTDFKPDTTQNIIPLLTFKKGSIEYVTEISPESEIRKEIEQRTYDESGNYIVNDFIVTPGVSTDTELRFNVSGGKAYVGGREVTTISSTEIPIPVPTTTETKTGYNITTSQGNYLLVTDVNTKGGSMILPKGETPIQGEIYLEMHNVTNPTAANAANTKVGTLVFKNLEYDSSLGNAVTQLKLFYHYYEVVKEAPATWTDWSVKYRIAAADGQYIANVFYSSPSANTFLGNYGVASTPCYALYREPGVDEVAYWYYQWANLDGKDIAKTKKKFAESILKDSTTTDYTRLTSSSKAFYAVINGSPFADGLLNVNQVRSIVGVNNASTSHYTTATYSSPFFYANIAKQGINSQNNLIIVDPRPSDSLIFPIGTKRYVKNVKNIRTTYTRVIRNAIFTSGIYTATLSYPESFNLGDGTVVASTARTNFIISIKSGGTTAVKYGIWNFEQGSVTISSDSTVATFNLGDPTFTGLADIEYLVQSDNLTPRTKTLIQDAYKTVNVTSPDLAYSLKVSDIAAFTGIYKLSNLNQFSGVWQSNISYTYNNLVLKNGVVYTAIQPSSNVSVLNTNVWTRVNSTVSSYFVFSDGQKDNWYDHGTIKYFGATSAVPGNVLVTYDYFTHSGEGPIVADSYPEAYYSSIPTYKSVTTSREYKLRDCLDFRPKRVNGSNYLNFDTAVFPTSSVNTDADVTYYLGRIDKLYISKDNVNFTSPYDKLYVESGVETNNPKSKNVVDDKSRLAIATLYVPPYATSAFDVRIEYEDNRRFTMKDIAKIEKETIRLDKIIKLQAVEIANLKSLIINDAGDTLLKSGILVENFDDFTKADITNGEYSIAISTGEGICYPLFSAKTVQFGITKSSNFSYFDDLITAKYTEEVFISQTDANSAINPNPGGIDDRRGRASVSKRNSYNLNLFEWGLAAAATYGIGTAAYAYAVNAAGAGYGFAGASSAVAAGYNAVVEAAGAAYTWVADKAAAAYSFVTGASAASAVSAASIITTTETGGYIVTTTFASGATTTSVVATSAEAAELVALQAETATAATSAGSWISTAWAEASSSAAAAVPYVAAAVAVYLIVDAIAPGVTKELKKAVNWVVDGVKNVANEVIAKPIEKVWNWIFSDIRMKENIVKICKLKSGLNLYTFKYKKQFRHLPGAGPENYYGLMAHEVEKLYPNAVTVHPSGYKMINYSLIGI